MRWLLGFVFFLLALGTGCGEHLDECEKRGLDCDDRNECTWDGCQVLWCAHGPVEDGRSCTGGLCLDGECVEYDDALPCTEQGIRLAIFLGGGPHRFDCGRPTTVVTQAEIEIDNDVILDGEGILTVEASSYGSVFSVGAGVTAELIGMTVTGGSGAGISNGGMLTLTNTTVSGNSGAGTGGGGVTNYGTLTLINGTVSGNSAQYGGGINNSGTLTLINGTVSGNSGQYGGGIYNSRMLTLIQSTVSSNDALVGGGGIVNGRTMTMTNCTVSGNGASDGGDIVNHSDATLTLTSSIVDGNCVNSAPLTSNGYNIESPGDTCGFDTSNGDQVNVTTRQLNLGPLQDNGGPTETHALLPGSPAINQIPVEDCLGGDGAPLATDQRGEPRPETGGTLCDVGAFERQPTEP